MSSCQVLQAVVLFVGVRCRAKEAPRVCVGRASTDFKGCNCTRGEPSAFLRGTLYSSEEPPELVLILCICEPPS